MFWYGCPKIIKHINKYKYTESSLRAQWDNVWFSKTKEIDHAMRVKFGHLIHSLLEYLPTNLFEKVGKMLLYDQVTRNIYRNTSQAYDYDNIARTLAYDIINEKIYGNLPLYIKISVILTLIHSENIEDHDFVTTQLDAIKEMHPYECGGVVRTLIEIAKRHRVRIEMFGRLPERAVIKNLKLSDVERLFLSNITSLLR